MKDSCVLPPALWEGRVKPRAGEKYAELDLSGVKLLQASYRANPR